MVDYIETIHKYSFHRLEIVEERKKSVLIELRSLLLVVGWNFTV